ncbi:hypothetical protein V492_05761 [Pseudogymnoascus sp. VKM F-4246]|nr:hypothetical protein V492_05761 [Pseudogymnoascus sp. VKM F-4246]
MARLPILSLFILTNLVGLVFAVDSEDLCTSDNLNFSYTKSFMPWFRSWKNVTSGPNGSDEALVKNMACWWYADCIYSLTAETRKQQYAAVSIVMALIPITLKDIAWPHRRMVHISEKKHWVVDTLIRALGLVPVIPKDNKKIKEMEGKWTCSHLVSSLILVLLVAFLLLGYGMLVVMELYSKRSSLGCPVPAFVALWFVVAFAPAAIEVAFSRYRDRVKSSSKTTVEDSESGENEALGDSNRIEHNTTVEVAKNIQGGEQNWFVQICWGFYYSAGSLIFTSIMLVSVEELFTWIVLSGVVTAASKLLGCKLAGYWGTGWNKTKKK